MAIGTSRAVEPADTHLINHTRHQTALRLLPFLFILYITSWIRGNGALLVDQRDSLPRDSGNTSYGNER
jgi:hypothetical protein